ncbi:MAG: MFS transporter [Proteobacteria bacterium]|nr:MFS transporter [Pseudomonadota bacterium]
MAAPDLSRTPRARRRRGAIGLDWFSFFLADVQTCFGPFMAVYLTSEKWANSDIGLMLTVGSIIGLAGQIPAGMLIDATQRERLIAAIAVACVGLSALFIALSSRFLFVILSQILHVAASVCIGPALAAMSLGLVGHSHLGLRLGRNAQFASAGSIFAIIVMGGSGYFLSSQAVFFMTTAMTIPALLALSLVSSRDQYHHRPINQQNAPYSVVSALRTLATNRDLRVLAIGVFFFHLANAGLMPLAASIITMRSEQDATILVALCLIIPQLVVTASSARIGNRADVSGRKPLLLCAFAALFLRALLLGFFREPVAFVALQIFDGISAAIIGVLVSVCVADLTEESHNFNLALGIVGAAMGLGAAASTIIVGDLADWAGAPVAFISMSIIAFVGLIVVGIYLPETKPEIAVD